MAYTLVFDIGKTNKKAFVFDEDFRQLEEEYIQIDQVRDEDGFPCDDLRAIVDWVRTVLHEKRNKYDTLLSKVNFTCYGASLVHLDHEDQPLTVLYNYLKPYPSDLLWRFTTQYGLAADFREAVASPVMGMLNSGLQLYWLKYTSPEVYAQVKVSLHLPQYLSFLFSNELHSDYTSIGCHTLLWDYRKSDYHAWVYAEGFHEKLAPIVSDASATVASPLYERLAVGYGVHDSSAALLTYTRLVREPFVLLSTGSWNVCMCPSNRSALPSDAPEADCLNFLTPEGDTVRASRAFIGTEYAIQEEAMRTHFAQTREDARAVEFSEDLLRSCSAATSARFRFLYLVTPWQQPADSRLDGFATYAEAYHALMYALVQLQMISLRLAVGDAAVRVVYVDGGFVRNAVFMQMLAQLLPQYEVRANATANGTAVGAALAVTPQTLAYGSLEAFYEVANRPAQPSHAKH